MICGSIKRKTLDRAENVERFTNTVKLNCALDVEF